MSIYVIYKCTSPSGKSYIGQTKNLKARIVRHKLKSSNYKALYNAIHKYGWNNFLLETLAETLTVEQANVLEECLIREHNTLSPNGYNLTTGGNNRKISEETRQKIILAKQNLSGETKRKMSEVRKGRQKSEDHKRKLSEAACKNRRSPV